jgi:hypothetical protein
VRGIWAWCRAWSRWLLSCCPATPSLPCQPCERERSHGFPSRLRSPQSQGVASRPAWVPGVQLSRLGIRSAGGK